MKKAVSLSLLLGLTVLLFGLTDSADRSAILEFPSSPAIKGSDFTMRCRYTRTHTVYFFVNFTSLGNTDTGEFTIRDVKRSHEGFYWCSAGLFTVSEKRWLSVTDPPVLSVVRLLCHLVAACPYCVCTALMVSVYCRERRANKPSVSKEMELRVKGRQGLADECDVTYDVVTEHNF